jgi:integrase
MIDCALPEASDSFLWDSEVKGFGVRIQPSGTKSYMVRYRTKEGTQRKQNLGRTNVLTPAEARELARKVLAKVAAGEDPMAERRKEESQPTIADLEERYTREHAKPFKKPASQHIDAQNWRLYILPEWRTRLVAEIKKSDILTLFGSMADKPAAANQTLALLSKAMNLAEDWGWRASNTNPCHRIKRYKLKKHTAVLTYEQMARLHQTMTKMVAERRLTPEFAAAIRLLQLTGCRKNEILEAETAWVDRSKRVLRLPDSKVGPRDIPLSEHALEIIEDLDGQYLIGGNRGKATSNVYRVWARVKKEAELPADLRIHDLRHSAGSLAHMAGMTQSQIAELLGHSILATTEKYIHNHDGDAAKAANVLGAVVTAAWKEPVAA